MAGQVCCLLRSIVTLLLLVPLRLPFYFIFDVVSSAAVPFGGFRLSADVYLHALNLQLYLLSKFQMQGFSKERCPTLYSAAAAFCVFTLVPVAINIAYEANARSAYLARRNLPHNDLNNFWQQVLRWGVTPDVQT